MIRPTGFGRDDEAAQTNSFMNRSTETAERVQERAKEEFDALASSLTQAGVEVLVFEDDLGLPDSVFPNNWISFHQPIKDGEGEEGEEGEESANPVIVTYPMLAESRRKERRAEILDAIAKFTGTNPDHIDLSGLEATDDYLEGTGSLVLDRVNNVAYACLSGRTSEDAVDAWADETEYQAVRFHGADIDGNPVYHTNVMLSIGTELIVACLESITDPDEYELVEASLKASGRAVMLISLGQVSHFCGNILELASKDGDPIFAMSQTAYEHFTDAQRAQIEGLGEVVHVPIPTIEYVAGGSVRCMIAELGISDSTG
jgi:hypothetical protein